MGVRAPRLLALAGAGRSRSSPGAGVMRLGVETPTLSGARWSVRGPAAGLCLRVLFGRFAGRLSPLPGFPHGFSWVIDHAHRLR